ncbi:hypothetical protein Tco_0228935 [Tanacetum coccineum]
MIKRNFFEIHGEFLVKIRDNTFNGIIGENAFEHINKFLKVIGPIKINGVSQDRFRLSIFPISLAGAAGEWFKKDGIGSVTTWEDLVEKFVQKFYQLSYDNEEIEYEEDDDPDDIDDIFKIEGNLFDYETPLCKAFNDFNYLLKINRDLFTYPRNQDLRGLWIKIPNVNKDELRLQVFSKSLSGDTEKWLSSEGTTTTWKKLDLAIRKIDDMVYSVKECVEHRTSISKASSTHFVKELNIGESSRSNISGESFVYYIYFPFLL